MTMKKPISLSDFLCTRATRLPLPTLRGWITKAGLMPEGRNGRTHLYSLDALVALLERHDRAAHPEIARSPRPSWRPWVPFAAGSRIAVTNAAGRRLVGTFIGYKGDVLARLQLKTMETVFAMDAIIESAESEAIDDNDGCEPVNVRNFWSIVSQREPRPRGVRS